MTNIEATQAISEATSLASTSAATLNGHILGAGMVFVLVILVIVIYLSSRNQNKSDERWSTTMNKNTEALRDLSDAHRTSGKDTAQAIERALIAAIHNTKTGG